MDPVGDRAAPSRSAVPDDWVELRVHGVSGTPPQDMLLTPHVVQVAGDDTSSFFRPADAGGREMTDPGHVLEAYHWGKFTSGSWRQGLWLALLPFGIVNAAQFMLPRPGPAPSTELFADPAAAWTPAVRAAVRWHAVAGAMLRLVGLALTCMLLLATAVVLVDLGAWQWAPSRGELVVERVPGWPVGLALLGCALVLLFLQSFGRDNARSARAGGRSGPDGVRAAAAGTPRGAPDTPPTDLGRGSFFRGDPDAPALRRLHVAVGLAFLAVLGLDAAARTALEAVAGGWLTVLAVGVALLGDPERGARGPAAGRMARWRTTWHERVLPAVTKPAVGGSTVLLAGAVVAASAHEHPAAAAGRAAPGIDGAAFGVLVVCVVALVVLFLATALLAVRTRRTGPDAPPPQFERFAMGLSPALLAPIGVFLGVGYSAALCYAAAGALNRGAGPEVEVPPLLQRVAYAWGLTVVVALGLVAVLTGSALTHRREFADRARAAFTFGGEPRCRLPQRWVATVGAAMFRARLKNSLEPVVWTFAATGVVLSVAAGVEYGLSRYGGDPCRTADLPGPLGLLSAPQSCSGPNLVIGLGTLVLLGLAAGLVLLGRGALRKPALRRGVNVVWDVIAFWPRAVHPFVPPPYSQLAVADLRERIRWHLGTTPVTTAANPRPAGSVMVAAHSQGSLIGLAALLWLTAAERARVGFVTFGSQLQVAFPRAFPAYVDVDVLRWLLGAYDGRWVSLYRDTDAIAGPVLSYDHAPDRDGERPSSRRLGGSGAVETDGIDPVTGRRVCGPEWRLLDPTPADPDLQTGPVAVLRGHSDYPADPDYPLALAAVRPAAPPPPGQSANSSATG